MSNQTLCGMSSSTSMTCALIILLKLEFFFFKRTSLKIKGMTTGINKSPLISFNN